MQVPDIQTNHISKLVLWGEALNFYDSKVVNGNDKVLNFVGEWLPQILSGMRQGVNQWTHKDRCSKESLALEEKAPVSIPSPSSTCCVLKQDPHPLCTHTSLSSGDLEFMTLMGTFLRVKDNTINNYTRTTDINFALTTLRCGHSPYRNSLSYSDVSWPILLLRTSPTQISEMHWSAGTPQKSLFIEIQWVMEKAWLHLFWGKQHHDR